MNKIVFTFFIFIFCFSFKSFAQESESGFISKLLIEAGIEYGGDEILQVLFTNGEDQSMKAGQGGYIALGGHFQFAKVESLLFRTTIGIKYNTTAAENANIRFTRIPINIMGYWKATEDIRIGIGVTAHQNIQLKGDSFVPDLGYISSIGPRVEIGWKWLALTYTAVNYTADTDGEYSAASVGLSASFTFPN